MDLNLLTFNSHAINDGTDYNAYILPESKFDLTSQPTYQDRAENYPWLGGAVLPAHSFTFQITILQQDLKDQDRLREQLKGWFAPNDFQPHALIAEDRNDITAGVKKQYQLIGLPARLAPDTGDGKGYVTFLITIATMEPIWQAVTATADSWAITATGQTHTVTPKGNTFSRPSIAITPTVARTGQFAYSRWCQIYNRVVNPLNNYPIEITNGGVNTANLVNDTTVSNQINKVGGILAGDTTIDIDTPVGGGLPTVGMGYVGTEQISWTNKTGTQLTGVTRGIGGTTAAVHADNAVIARSKMLADGTDIAVQYDGQLVNRWIDSPNSASTKIWFNGTWQSTQAGTLRTALPNNGTAVTVQFTINTANKNLLTALKQAKNSVFIIQSEAFTFLPGNVDLVAYQITSCNRAQKNTSFASHAAAVAITWIEHDIWLMYGNSAGSPFTTDDSFKPVLNLNTSTNTSWVYTNFFDTSSANRSAAWRGTVITSVGRESVIYTGNQTALANPSTELGLSLIDYLQANIWKAETAELAWSLYHPSGITTVSMSGSKRMQNIGTWPAVAGLQKSPNGSLWQTVWTEAVPATANSWTAFAHAGQSLSGTYTNIRLALKGTIAGLTNNQADIQGDTVTLTLDNTVSPSVTMNSENSQYYLNLKITNTTTGDYLTITAKMELAATLTIDTVKKTVKLGDGSNMIAGLVLSSTRNDWLRLVPGANVLQVDDTGIANITLVNTYNDRNF